MSVFIDQEKCRRCGRCVEQCPVQAISMENGIPVINPQRCLECLECMDVCPVGAIYQVSEVEQISPLPEQNLAPLEKQPFWTPERKEQAIAIGGALLSGLAKLVESFFSNSRFGDGRGAGRGRGFGRGKGRGRGRGRGNRGGGRGRR